MMQIFFWDNQCDLSFQMLKDALCSAPILKYPDMSKPYTIYADPSKYGWAGVITQEHTSVIDGKEVTAHHPVSLVSGLFHGSQLYWATKTKEVYAIYMTVKKSTFYITGHQLTLRSDHFLLNKFLTQMTLHMAGKDNMLVDTLNRLIDINPDIVLEPEFKNYEFRRYAFDILLKASSDEG